MKQPQNNIIRSKKYSYLSPRKIQILEDPDCLNVTEQEVRALYTVLRRKNKPDLIAIIQNRYPQYFNVRGKQIILAAGLNPDDFTITTIGSGYLHINGFTEYEWRLLYDPNFTETSATKIKHTITVLRSKGKDAAVDVIANKYQHLLVASNFAALQKCGVDATTDQPAPQIEQHRIDGMPIALWRALNDPAYVPSVVQLKKWIKRFEENAEISKAIFLMDKYEALLEEESTEPELSIDDASDIFESVLGCNYSRKQK